MILMNKLFYPYLDEFVIIFIDDILVYSQSKEDHAKYLRMVLQLLQEKHLYTKFSKYKFWLNQVIFLSHIVSGDGIMIDLNKVEVVIS